VFPTFVCLHDLRRAISSQLTLLRTGGMRPQESICLDPQTPGATRPRRLASPHKRRRAVARWLGLASQTSQACQLVPSLLALSRWRGRGSSASVQRAARATARPQRRQARGHRSTPQTSRVLRNTNNPQRACQNWQANIDAPTSLTRIKRSPGYIGLPGRVGRVSLRR
jgi:hypothetical protein